MVQNCPGRGRCSTGVWMEGPAHDTDPAPPGPTGAHWHSQIPPAQPDPTSTHWHSQIPPSQPDPTSTARFHRHPPAPPDPTGTARSHQHSQIPRAQPDPTSTTPPAPQRRSGHGGCAGAKLNRGAGQGFSARACGAAQLQKWPLWQTSTFGGTHGDVKVAPCRRTIGTGAAVDTAQRKRSPTCLGGSGGFAPIVLDACGSARSFAGR